MDAERVRQLVELCLACAGREDDPRERQLGPIHVLKYVYLADLAHAERNGGVTFTGAAWKFYHFGPWSAEVHDLLEPSARAAGAEVTVIPSRYDRDTVRWVLHDDELCDRLVDQLPSEVTNAIREAVHRFGAGTGDLLNFVYLTRPMLSAAPGEALDFTPPAPSNTSPQPTAEKPSRAAERSRREALASLRSRVRDQLQRRSPRNLVPPSPAPRFDDVYVQGQEWLDALAGPENTASEGELRFDEEVWKSRGRSERDVP